MIPQKLKDKFAVLKKPTLKIYPILIILGIPTLLIINTVWNLKSFNRDVNFIIRHQAVSTADTLKPLISQEVDNINKLSSILQSTIDSNPDIISLTILVLKNNTFEVLSSTLPANEALEAAQTGLTQLAAGFNQPFAGLIYDPALRKKVWNVIVPLEVTVDNPLFLSVKLKTDPVETILSRTSRDSLIILAILVVVSILLLANHFIFYRKAAQTQQLEELDKLKDEFISMAAHELKAPITGLTGYLQLLQDKISPNELSNVSSDLGTIDLLIANLSKLINDLLDVSRIEQGRLKIEIKQVQVNDIIGSVITSLSPQAQQKNLSIKFSPTEILMIKSDPDRLRQVITNLVSNSIKYTIKGEINITSKVKGKFIEVNISDTGIGIPAKELQKLFTKFHRVKDRQAKEVRGTGLGLWITKQIVELLGGNISAESIYGTGTSITFTLPLSS